MIYALGWSSTFFSPLDIVDALVADIAEINKATEFIPVKAVDGLLTPRGRLFGDWIVG